MGTAVISFLWWVERTVAAHFFVKFFMGTFWRRCFSFEPGVCPFLRLFWFYKYSHFFLGSSFVLPRSPPFYLAVLGYRWRGRERGGERESGLGFQVMGFERCRTRSLRWSSARASMASTRSCWEKSGGVRWRFASFPLIPLSIGYSFLSFEFFYEFSMERDIFSRIGISIGFWFASSGSDAVIDGIDGSWGIVGLIFGSF